jgi:hypothetical protein
VNRAFSPSLDEVERAQRLVAAFAAQQAAGAGAFSFEGKMVDMPMLRAAQRILARRGTVDACCVLRIATQHVARSTQPTRILMHSSV